MVDVARVRREGMRWNLLSTLHKASPYPSTETFLLDVMQSIYPDVSAMEVRRELDYLGDRRLIKLDKKPSGVWIADIDRYGTDLVEYAVDCDPGIARPLKYWAE